MASTAYHAQLRPLKILISTLQASSGVPFSTPIPMALYPTLATLLTTSGLAVTALFYVCVAAAPHPAACL